MERELRLLLSQRAFRIAAARYRRRWRVRLCAVSHQGRVFYNDADEPWSAPFAAEVRRLAVNETLRWGEPAVVPGPRQTLLWAVPLMLNAKLLGGLVAGTSEKWLFPRGLDQPRIDVRAACTGLRELAEKLNLTNASALELRRSEYQREQARADAIHGLKASRHYDLRAMYLLEEPRLITSIRMGDRREARAILNRLLVAMIHQAGERLDLAKSFFMELAVMMSRTSVESGSSPQAMFGDNFASLAELSAINSEEKLASWLHDTLERIMDSIHRNRARTSDVLLGDALRHMSQRCCDADFGRDEAAAVACVSPPHFSRLIYKRFGQNFTDVLNQMRIDRAVELLSQTDKPLKTIAQETGFCDQSYFTKVFKRWRNVSPDRFRRLSGTQITPTN